jgi:phage shock protein A
MAEAQTRVHDAVSSVDLMDPTSEVSRFEDKVRREEARVLGRQELRSPAWTRSSSRSTITVSCLRSKHG